MSTYTTNSNSYPDIYTSTSYSEENYALLTKDTINSAVNANKYLRDWIASSLDSKKLAIWQTSDKEKKFLDIAKAIDALGSLKRPDTAPEPNGDPDTSGTTTIYSYYVDVTTYNKSGETIETDKVLNFPAGYYANPFKVSSTYNHTNADYVVNYETLTDIDSLLTAWLTNYNTEYPTNQLSSIKGCTPTIKPSTGINYFDAVTLYALDDSDFTATPYITKSGDTITDIKLKISTETAGYVESGTDFYIDPTKLSTITGAEKTISGGIYYVGPEGVTMANAIEGSVSSVKYVSDTTTSVTTTAIDVKYYDASSNVLSDSSILYGIKSNTQVTLPVAQLTNSQITSKTTGDTTTYYIESILSNEGWVKDNLSTPVDYTPDVAAVTATDESTPTVIDLSSIGDIIDSINGL